MDEDTISIIVLLILGIIFCFLVVGIISLPICYCKNKDIELEKYRIEMQVNNGDIPKKEGE